MLSEHAHHLAHGGAHRVFGVIGQDLALICHERASAELAALGQGSLLHHQFAGQAVKVRRHDAPGLLLLDPGRSLPAMVSDCAFSTNSFASLCPCSRVRRRTMHLVLQSEPVQLTAGGHPDVSRERHVIASKALTCTVRYKSHTSLPGTTACSPEAAIPRLADPVGRHTQIRPTSPGSLGWHAVPAEGPGRHLPTRPEPPGGKHGRTPTTSYREKTGTLGGPLACPGVSCTSSFAPRCPNSSAVSAPHWSSPLLPGGPHAFAAAMPGRDRPRRTNSRSAPGGRPSRSPHESEVPSMSGEWLLLGGAAISKSPLRA